MNVSDRMYKIYMKLCSDAPAPSHRVYYRKRAMNYILKSDNASYNNTTYILNYHNEW